MIISFYEIQDWEKEYFEQHLSEHTLYFFKDPISQETIQQDTEILSTSIYSQITPAIIDKMPNLRCIATRSTGIDHIDSLYCQTKGIRVKNVPSYGVDTIAEHTFALVLCLTRHIFASVERTRKGNFSMKDLQGWQLAGKTIGIIGLGAIGKRVAELARSFRMYILAYSRTKNIQYEQTLGVTYVDLITLLRSSDIISLHVPSTPETYHLINTTNVHECKKGNMLINTARGAVVETQAILVGLEQGIFSGVGLDVLEEEKAFKEERELLTANHELSRERAKTHLLNHLLLHHDRVIITPHNAFNSKEALEEIVKTTVATIKEATKE